jgi:hypothetical protein
VDSVGDGEMFAVRANNMSDIKGVIGRVVQNVEASANE